MNEKLHWYFDCEMFIYFSWQLPLNWQLGHNSLNCCLKRFCLSRKEDSETNRNETCFFFIVLSKWQTIRKFEQPVAQRGKFIDIVRCTSIVRMLISEKVFIHEFISFSKYLYLASTGQTIRKCIDKHEYRLNIWRQLKLFRYESCWIL